MKMYILFYGKRKRLTKENTLPIYLRVTINGLRYEITTNRFVDPNKWSGEAGKVKGSSVEARQLNYYFDELKQKAYEIQRSILTEGKALNIFIFKERWLGRDDTPNMLMQIFKEHNEKMQQLIGIDYRKGTYICYQTTLKHTASFLYWKFGSSDIEVRKLNYHFVTDFEFWLKSQKHCGHNTAMKYIGNVRKIINFCLKSGWLSTDPFLGYNKSRREVIKEYLTNEELNAISEKQFVLQRLDMVRDIFLFSCYTGLAYADVKKLRQAEIVIGLDKEQWIFTKRQKTDYLSRIPLLPRALAIIEKYRDYPGNHCPVFILPVLSNQKMNAYLKEIADLCSIQKNLTLHTARHTFATTVTLSNGIPMETVGKMLGNRNIKTTQ